MVIGWLIFTATDLPAEGASRAILLAAAALPVPALYRNYERLRAFVGLPQMPLLSAIFLLYVGFAFSGNYLFVYPLDMPLTGRACALYLLTCLWTAPAALSFLALLYSLATRPGRRITDDTSSPRLYALSFTLILSVTAVYLTAFNPCVSTPDTYRHYIQAKGLIPLYTDQTVFETLFIRYALQIHDSPMTVVIVQSLFAALVWAACLTFLRARGLSLRACFISTLIVALSPNNALHLVTIWKDIPYTISLLWLTLLTAKAAICRDKPYPPSFLLQLVISLTFVCLFRHNGILPCLVTALALPLLTGLNRRITAALAVAAVLILTIGGPLYSYLGVRATPDYSGFKWLSMEQDILAVDRYGGTLDQAGRELVERIEAIKEDSRPYTPYKSTLSYALEVDAPEFIALYFRAFANNPLIMLKSALCRNDCGWNVFLGRDSYTEWAAYTYTEQYRKTWREIAGIRGNTVLTLPMTKFMRLTRSTIPDAIFWRAGLSAVMIVGSAVALYASGRARWLAALVPWAGQFLSLLIAAAHNDYRYHWPSYIVAIFFVLLASSPGAGRARQ